MKYIFFACILFAVPALSPAQFNLKKLGDKVNQKVNQRIENKTDKAIDKGLDKAESGGKEAATGEKTNETGESSDKSGGSKPSAGTGLKSYSKFDFVPGSNIVFAEDFSQDAIGEFPMKWNTNGSGEIVTIDNVQGKWLDLFAGATYEMPYNKKLPENFTIEFDLLVQSAESMRVPEIAFQLDQEGGSNHYPLVNLRLTPNGGTNASDYTNDRADFTSYNSKGTVFLDATDQLIGEFAVNNGKHTPVHVAIWVQKTRFRAWVNSQKIYDLPKGMSPDAVSETNKIQFEIGSYGSAKSNYQYYLSNIKIAEGAPDTRSKLITEGKFSTTGILFDVNSDKIKPGSYGVLKEIAGVLKENPGIRIKILGHTDSDGDDSKNMELSKRRAAAVKAALASEFGIDAETMVTDGSGETKPAGDNKTPEGKARNRRVEFIKM